MNKKVTFNQITLITDGYSNEGISPIIAAKYANQLGITVNVIGIIDDNQSTLQGQLEIENISKAGGGLYQLVTLENFAKTVQLITRNALTNTVQQVVQSQLIQMIGINNLTSISPNQRVQATNIIENLAEYSQLNVLLLIDQSASMLSKMSKIEEALYDFKLSLQSRAGNSKVSVITFPGLNTILEIQIPWTNKMENIDTFINKLRPNGNTPTGPAISSCVEYFLNVNTKSNKVDGVLSEYIV